MKRALSFIFIASLAVSLHAQTNSVILQQRAGATGKREVVVKAEAGKAIGFDPETLKLTTVVARGEAGVDYIPVTGSVAAGKVPVADSTTTAVWKRQAASPVALSGTAIDWEAGTTFSKTLSANTTFTFSNSTNGYVIIVALTNTGGNYTVTWPTVSWSGGTTPTQTTGAKTDVYTFVKIGSTIYGSVIQNF